jgi:hypothetical protein
MRPEREIEGEILQTMEGEFENGTERSIREDV